MTAENGTYGRRVTGGPGAPRGLYKPL